MNGDMKHEDALKQVGNELNLNENQFEEFRGLVNHMIFNTYTSRDQFIAKMLDPRRDIERECGYPILGQSIDPELYYNLFSRGGVANRVVTCLPQETFQIQPWVYEDENPDNITPFEQAWYDLCISMLGMQSWYNDVHSFPIWSYFERADIQQGIGHYGGILVGVNDGKPLHEPAAGIEELGSIPMGKDGTSPSINFENLPRYTFNVNYAVKPDAPSTERTLPKQLDYKNPDKRQLLFLRVLPESLAPINKVENNPSSPRFGYPTEYGVTINDSRDATIGSISGAGTQTTRVHWSRFVHMADNLSSSEVFGAPRMRPVLDNLLGLRKLYSGSPEMYWKGAFPGLSLETHPSLGGDVPLNRDQTKNHLEQYQNGLQRYLALTGMTAKMLSPTVVDPSKQIEVQIDAICIQMGIPKRVFMGSERGQLASAQDDATWNDRLGKRQRNYVTPRMIVPFIDRLIMMGILPQPKKGYTVEWPDITSQTAKDRTIVSVGQVKAICQYLKDGGQHLIAPIDFFTRIMGFSEEAAKSMIKNQPKTPPVNPDLINPPKPVAGGSGGKPKGNSQTNTTIPRHGRRASDHADSDV